jgi:hypothetical protein
MKKEIFALVFVVFFGLTLASAVSVANAGGLLIEERNQTQRARTDDAYVKGNTLSAGQDWGNIERVCTDDSIRITKPVSILSSKSKMKLCFTEGIYIVINRSYVCEFEVKEGGAEVVFNPGNYKIYWIKE